MVLSHARGTNASKGSLLVQQLLRTSVHASTARVAFAEHSLLEIFVRGEDVETQWQLLLLHHLDALVHVLHRDHWQDRAENLLVHDRGIRVWVLDHSEGHVPGSGIGLLGSSADNLP